MASYQYNGVFLQLTQTLEFSWKMPRDPTYTDALYTEYTIRVRGFLSISEGSFPGVNEPKSSAETIALIKSKLEAPRRPMLYIMGATPMIQVPEGEIDDKLGPDPLPATVREVSTGTFLVECGCIVRLVECDAECPEGATFSPVISLRWTQSESFDQNWNSNLTTDGKLIVRSSLLQCADNFRIECTPPLLPDYIRTKSQYTLSPDGLEVDFHFEDQEVDRLPPFPSTTANGTYVVVTPQPGFRRIGTVMLELEGPKGTDRKALMNRAIRMAYNKLATDGFLGGKGSVPIWWGQFNEDLFVPKIAVTMSAMLTNLSGPKVAFAAANDQVPVMPSCGVQTFGLQSNQPGISPPDRKRIAGLLVASFLDPCLCIETEKSMQTTTQGPSFQKNPDMLQTGGALAGIGGSITLGGTGTSPSTITIGSTSSNSTEVLSDTAPYTICEIETTVVNDSGNVQMPGTGLGSQGGVSAIVKAHGGMMSVMTTWVMSRIGAPPVYPTFESPNSNLVPLRGSVVMEDARVSPDGQNMVFSGAGYYWHAILNPQNYQIAPAVAPFYNDLVRQGGGLAASAWTNLITWAVQAQVSSGSQPFQVGGVQPEQPPQTPQGFQESSIPTDGGGSQQQSTNTSQDQGYFFFTPNIH